MIAAAYQIIRAKLNRKQH